RKARPRHAVSVDVDHRPGAAVERVMILGVDMPRQPHIRGSPGGRVPATAAEDKRLGWAAPRGLEEKLAYAGFPVGQAIAEKPQCAVEVGVGCHGMMGERIQRVVDRNTVPRSPAAILLYDRSTASVGENEVIPGNQLTKRIFSPCRDPLQCRGRIDIPEYDRGVGPA